MKDYCSFDDEKLLELIEEDNLAFKELMNRYKNKLFNFTIRYLNDFDKAKDIVQEVFIKVFRFKSSFESKKSKFSTWIFTICRNTAYDNLRKNRFNKFIKSLVFKDNEDNSLNLEKYISYIVDFDENIKKNEILLEIEKALTKISIEQKEVFLLKVKEDFSIQEISEMLDVNKETVKSRLRYATKKLQEILKKNQIVLGYLNELQ